MSVFGLVQCTHVQWLRNQDRTCMGILDECLRKEKVAPGGSGAIYYPTGIALLANDITNSKFTNPAIYSAVM